MSPTLLEQFKLGVALLIRPSLAPVPHISICVSHLASNPGGCGKPGLVPMAPEGMMGCARLSATRLREPTVR